MSQEPDSKSLVMIVDDLKKNLQVVGNILSEFGYEVTAALSGKQALERVNSAMPDLILLDLMMPEMDGLEVCRRLKANADTRDIPVIFLTASNEVDHLLEAFRIGAVDYVVKPFMAQELIARVNTHMELKKTRESLLEMNQEKDELLGIVAHDLKNPLAAIRGMAELFLEDTEMAAERRISIGKSILFSAERLNELVKNLLDINAIESGEVLFNISACDICNSVQSALESSRHLAEGKAQQLLVEMPEQPLMVLADPVISVQVFDNLISNAIKYSQPGKRIWVTLITEPEQVVVQVRDEGPGIPEDEQPRLFKKFSRLSPQPTAGESSTGLGLSIVHKLVAEMHGSVWCRSKEGVGSAFFVALPRVKPQEPITGEGQQTSGTASNPQ